MSRPPPPFPRFLLPPPSRSLPRAAADVLVIGSGIAGLSAALAAASEGARVLIVTKRTAFDGSTGHAQGGVAAAMAPGDSVERHLADTLSTGQGLSDPEVVDAVVRDGVLAVQEVMRWGLRFDRIGRRLSFGLEGGHSRPRILHAGGDATGKALEETLLRRVRADRRISLREHTFTLDLLKDDSGVIRGVLTASPRGTVEALSAGAVILATGGAGQLYRETTNPDVVTGDGIAMALRAGAEVGDLEFVQFHPTTLYVAGATRMLISEAARGEGGVLRDRNGVAFMSSFHASADLAPRDVVSRAIVERMRRTGDTQAYLDLTRLKGSRASRRFPQMTKICRAFGLDPDRDFIPVRPSAHYWIGGVRVDLSGRSGLPGLYACGEAALTGLHGANRLASNSLLEGLVFGRRAALAAVSALPARRGGRLAGVARPRSGGGEPMDLADARNALRSLCWRRVGIERDATGLTEALRQILFWERYLFTAVFPDPGGWELQNLLVLAHALTESALAREESRGVHFRADFPERDDKRWLKRLLWRDGRLFSEPLLAVPQEHRVGSRHG